MIVQAKILKRDHLSTKAVSNWMIIQPWNPNLRIMLIKAVILLPNQLSKSNMIMIQFYRQIMTASYIAELMIPL